MTNKEDEGEAGCEPRLAALLAVHLVSQILDEAYVIANAATDSGQPWRYLTMLKNLRNGQLKDGEEEVTFCASNAENVDTADSNMEPVSNIVATSTPQKFRNDEVTKVIETTFIGQGDEDMDMRQNELTKSTSMFINHLFDMSEVERAIICDDTQVIQSDSNELITQAMTKIMESYVNAALEIAFGPEGPNTDSAGERSPSTENSGYSFLTDAYAVEMSSDVAFYVDIEDNKNVASSSEEARVIEQETEQSAEEMENDAVKKDDVAFYENTYLTLNRDYDLCSDEEGDPVLQDTKGILQEVELMTRPTTGENTPRVEEESVQDLKKELTAISAVSASASGSRKSSLVQRCRTQGARLLACLRGWWRRKTPGKRKEARVPGSVRGLCPLSPDARRRAASLLDQRMLGSPRASQHVVWKFNTVSEALVNSSCWKNYTFDVTPDECGEY